ncbi:MAG: VWA domain-containing protein [candidate division Zixibacteria bacterium]|nr:VWA domain-containing protein [candidate division Zixibacteria bacterium]
MSISKSVNLVIIIGVILGLSCSDSGTGPDGSSSNSFNLMPYQGFKELPCFINIMFQVTDADYKGVSDLTTDDFSIYEDGQLVSPTESFPLIRHRQEIPYKLKTVLMIDNSASVGANLDEIKDAAIELVGNIADQQQFAIYKFSESAELVQYYTSDVGTLTAAIESIALGYATTDLYGSVIVGVDQWDDYYSLDSVQQGFMIMMTDGSDTQHSHTLSEAISARGDKRVYTVGLGNEIEPDKLDSIGNAGYFSISNADEVSAKFQEIQDDIIEWANSFYHLSYMSPTRHGNHTLRLEIKNNNNTGSYSYISCSFNSDGFYPVLAGVQVKLSTDEDYGRDEITCYYDSTVTLKATTYQASELPIYVWSTNCDNISIVPDGGDNTFAYVTVTGVINIDAAIMVGDTVNNLADTISVTLLDAIVEVGSYNLPGMAYNVFVRNNYAYVAGSTQGLLIIDVSESSNPTLTGTYDTPGSAHGVFIQSDYAYVADYGYGLKIIDISVPSNPTLAGLYNISGSAYGVFIQGDYAFVANGGSGLIIIDIGNPSNPTLTGSYDTPNDSRGVFIQGDYAFVADKDSGLQIIDVSDKSNPTLAGAYDTPGQAYNVFVQGNYAYVADDGSGLQIIDVSDKSNPTLTGNYDTPGGVRGIFVLGDYAYTADVTYGLQMIDVSNPYNPTLNVAYNNTVITWNVFIQSHYAYVADAERLLILRISGI